MTGGTNRVLFASENSGIRENLANGITKLNDETLSQFLGNVDSQLVSYSAGAHILTDDKAPVEVLSMQALDSIIKDELSYYKSIFKKNGIQGLIDSF